MSAISVKKTAVQDFFGFIDDCFAENSIPIALVCRAASKRWETYGEKIVNAMGAFLERNRAYIENDEFDKIHGEFVLGEKAFVRIHELDFCSLDREDCRNYKNHLRTLLKLFVEDADVTIDLPVETAVSPNLGGLGDFMAGMTGGAGGDFLKNMMGMATNIFSGMANNGGGLEDMIKNFDINSIEQMIGKNNMEMIKKAAEEISSSESGFDQNSIMNIVKNVTENVLKK